MINNSLKNKVILITGGEGLLGREMVQNLSSKGSRVISLDINIETDLDKGKINCDVTSFESIKAAIEITMTNYGKIDGLVNNAYPRTDDWGSDFLDISETSLKNNIDWQLNSYILFCQQVILRMIAQNSGTIINIASIYGVVGNDFTIYENTPIIPPAPYSAIKGGVISFTRFLASKYGQYDIRVNCVSPGGIFNDQPSAFVNAYEKKVPLKRMGQPDDIAPTIAFLLSDEARYITGQNIIIDGGWTAI